MASGRERTTYNSFLGALAKGLNHKFSLLIKKALPAVVYLSFVTDKIGGNVTKSIYSGSYEKYCLRKHKNT